MKMISLCLILQVLVVRIDAMKERELSLPRRNSLSSVLHDADMRSKRETALNFIKECETYSDIIEEHDKFLQKQLGKNYLPKACNLKEKSFWPWFVASAISGCSLVSLIGDLVSKPCDSVSTCTSFFSACILTGGFGIRAYYVYKNNKVATPFKELIKAKENLNTHLAMAGRVCIKDDKNVILKMIEERSKDMGFEHPIYKNITDILSGDDKEE